MDSGTPIHTRRIRIVSHTRSGSRPHKRSRMIVHMLSGSTSHNVLHTAPRIHPDIPFRRLSGTSRVHMHPGMDAPHRQSDTAPRTRSGMAVTHRLTGMVVAHRQSGTSRVHTHPGMDAPHRQSGTAPRTRSGMVVAHMLTDTLRVHRQSGTPAHMYPGTGHRTLSDTLIRIRYRIPTDILPHTEPYSPFHTTPDMSLYIHNSDSPIGTPVHMRPRS
jgi:hypothetical protein